MLRKILLLYSRLFFANSKIHLHHRFLLIMELMILLCKNLLLYRRIEQCSRRMPRNQCPPTLSSRPIVAFLSMLADHQHIQNIHRFPHKTFSSIAHFTIMLLRRNSMPIDSDQFMLIYKFFSIPNK